MNQDRKISRRRLLKVIGSTAVVAVGASALSACGGKEEAPAKPTSLSCTDTAGLSQGEISMRNSQAYVDASPDATKNCANCNFFTDKGDAACGSCTVIKGPIHPKGYCKLWAKKA